MKSSSNLPYDESAFETLGKIEFELKVGYFGNNIFSANQYTPLNFGDEKGIYEVFAVSNDGLDKVDGYCFFSVDSRNPGTMLYKYMVKPDVKNPLFVDAEFLTYMSSELVAWKTLCELNNLDYSTVVNMKRPVSAGELLNKN